MHAAAAGSLAGFDGAQLEVGRGGGGCLWGLAGGRRALMPACMLHFRLSSPELLPPVSASPLLPPTQVRSAGEEAWLGGPAPHVPELDGPLDEDAPAGAGPTLALPPPGGPGAAAAGVKGSSSALALAAPAGAPVDPLVAWDYRRTTAAGGRRRTSFRSIKEAVAAARDGDRILLRRGVHNGMGCALLRCALLGAPGAAGGGVGGGLVPARLPGCPLPHRLMHCSHLKPALASLPPCPAARASPSQSGC